MTPVIVSVITAAVALLTAVINLLWQRRSSREILLLQKRLDKENQERTEYLKRFLEAFVQGHERELKAYRDILNAGQRIRDLLHRLSEGKLTYHIPLLAEELRGLSKDILDGYAVSQLDLPPAARAKVHRFKNVCGDAAAALATALSEGRPLRAALDQLRPTEAELAAAHDDVRELALAAAREYADELRRRSSNDA